jgi:hypothetical protein
VSSQLAGAVAGLAGDVGLFTATVASFDAAKHDLVLWINGGQVPHIGYNAGYAPVVGDSVAVLRVGNTMLCLCKIMGTAS